MTPKVGDLVRVVQEDRDDGYVNLNGSLGVLLASDHTAVFPYDLLVGVGYVLGVNGPDSDCCYRAEPITEEEYLREYTLARLRDRIAYSLEELKEAYDNAQKR